MTGSGGGPRIDAGRGVHYDCSSPALARELTQLAAQIGLAGSQFYAVEQTPPEQIGQLPPAEPDPPAPAAPVAITTSPAAVCAPVPPQPALKKVEPDLSLPQEPAQTPEQAAERQRRINELLGYDNPKPAAAGAANQFCQAGLM